jgi:gluconolactonase
MVLAGGAVAICMGQGIVNLPAGLADASAKVEGVKTGLAYCEGPALDKNGNLYFSEMSTPQMKLWKVTPEGTAAVFRTSTFFNGNECDMQGRLVCCEQDRITRVTLETRKIDTLSKSGDNGFQLLQTNDLTIGTSGAMFFTNHNSGMSVFYRSPSGALQRWTGLPIPNGVEWIEEKGLLYLSLSDTNMVMSYTVAADGAISNRKKFASLSVPDGITIDERYNVYVASYLEGKIYVFDSTGKTLGNITMQGSTTAQGNASNCVFGGVDNKTLYITGNGGAYKIHLAVAGRTKGGASVVKSPRVAGPAFTAHEKAQGSLRYTLTGRRISENSPGIVTAAGIFVQKTGLSQRKNSLSVK